MGISGREWGKLPSRPLLPERILFLGEFQHTVDDKGRLAIPAKFRPPLSEGLVVTRGIEKCLYVWPMDQWQELAQRLAKLPMLREDARRVSRHFFSGAVDTNLDKLGRIVLPQFLREYAGLGDEVAVVGAFTRIEIWGRDSWNVERSLAEAQSSVIAEHLADLGF